MSCCFRISKKTKSRRMAQATDSVPSHPQRHGTCQNPPSTVPLNPHVEKKLYAIADPDSGEEQLIKNKRKKENKFDWSAVKTTEETKFSGKVEMMQSGEEKGRKEEAENERESKSKELSTSWTSSSSTSTSVSSLFSYPPSHRYGNCPTVPDDNAADDQGNRATNSESLDGEEVEAEESSLSSSLFSLSIESRKHAAASSTATAGDEKEEVNSPIPTADDDHHHAHKVQQVNKNHNQSQSEITNTSCGNNTCGRDELSISEEVEDKYYCVLRAVDANIFNNIDPQSRGYDAKVMTSKMKQMNIKKEQVEGEENNENQNLIIRNKFSGGGGGGSVASTRNEFRSRVVAVAVDTSLSSWLVQTTTESSTSDDSVGNPPYQLQ